jgi:bifunctional pyridoxal-dependent enzyme with beta-cystathionase and maltose regulon repressor activities
MSEATVADPLEVLALTDLRQRTSIKWRSHPDDVLPMWVAEMDVPLAVPVVATTDMATAALVDHSLTRFQASKMSSRHTPIRAKYHR